LTDTADITTVEHKGLVLWETGIWSISMYMYTYSTPQHPFSYTVHKHCLKGTTILLNTVNVIGSLWRVCCTI